MVIASCVKEFILQALREEQRIDGRRAFDFRRLSIKFAREDGTAEVQLGQTHVLCVVTAQLTQPYPERPNEGTLAVFTEFSPMADPSFEPGRPGEYAVELGRIIDRGLRESRAVDMESLCVLSGKSVWALRVDIHILDNGGNLVDAANIAALAGLLSFRRPECSIEGPEGQEVVIHSPEIREPHPLTLHFLPIAITFAFFADGDLVVIDPNFKEELIMKARLTVILNSHGDICAIQKGGGVGVASSEILRCLRIALTKAGDITTSLKKAVEAHEIERAQRKIKRHRNILSESVQELSTKDVEADTEMSDAMGGSMTEKFPLDNIKPQVMSEDSSSDDSDDENDSDDDDDDDEDEDEEKDDLGLKSVETSTLQNSNIFEGGASQWEAKGSQQSVNASSKCKVSRSSGRMPVDEYDGVADVIAQAAVSAKFRTGISSEMKGEANEKVKKELMLDRTKQTAEAALQGSTLEQHMKNKATDRPLSLLDAVKKKTKKKAVA